MTVVAKGRTYVYFHTGSDQNGRRLFARLPHPDSSEFEVAYLAMLDARGEDPSVAAETALASHRAKRKFVYFIGSPGGPIKIGFATNPPVRLQEIQVGSPVELTILCLAEGGSKLEKTYHAKFAQHRLIGEWFSPHPDILAEVNRLNVLSRNRSLGITN